MSFLDQARKGAIKDRAKIYMVYGVAGIGKTTAFAELPDSVIIPTEDNQDHVDSAIVLPLARSFNDVLAMISEIGQTEDFKVSHVGIDSISALDRLINDQVCQENDVQQIEKIPYGKGKEFALQHWKTFWGALAWLRDVRNISVCLIAHPKIIKEPNPDGESYDTYRPDLNDKALEMLRQNCNGVFFCNYKVFVRKQDKGFGQTEAKGVGNGDRIMYTQKRPTYVAKSACNPALPQEMELDLNKLFELWQA